MAGRKKGSRYARLGLSWLMVGRSIYQEGRKGEGEGGGAAGVGMAMGMGVDVDMDMGMDMGLIIRLPGWSFYYVV